MVPEEGKIHLSYNLFANFIERVKKYKTSKNKEPRDSEDSGIPNETVPEEAKIHLSYNLFANFIERAKK